MTRSLLVLIPVLLLCACTGEPPADAPAGPVSTTDAPARPISAADAPAGLPDWKQPFWPDDPDWRAVEQHLRFNNDAEVTTLDPHLMTWVHDSRIGRALFEGLVGNDPQDLSIRPAVAASWTISEDGLHYTFHLREDARWSDGEALTATHFVQSWRRALDPDLAAPYAYQLFPIAGAEAYFNGETTDPASIGVRARDAHTLAVELAGPCPWFLEICAFSTLYPVRLDVIEEHGTAWTQPEHLVGNGPFGLSEWKPRQYIRMQKNPHYWDADFVKLDTITAYPYDDADAALRQYEAGVLDWTTSVPHARVDELKTRSAYFAVPYMGTYFYRFNCSRPPFDDARVRRAFSMSIDRQAITEHVTGAGEIPATWYCPPVAGYEHVAGLDEDPVAAKALLAEAGYGGPDGDPFPEVELWYNTSDNHKRIAEAIADRWQRLLGVTVRLRNSDAKSFFSRMKAIDYDIIRSSWIGDYNDPNTFFDLFVSDGGNNRTGWSHQRYDELLAASQQTNDMAARMALFQDMERILVQEELPILPIYLYVTKGMLRDTIRGFTFNIRDIHPFQYLWMAPAQ